MSQRQSSNIWTNIGEGFLCSAKGKLKLKERRGTVNCIVCNGKLLPFFTKDFGGRWGLNEVEYWRCGSCGLTISKTVYNMSQEDWELLNERYHGSLFKIRPGTRHEDDSRRRMRLRGLKRLRAQAENFALLANKGLLSSELPWIDYGCGDGTLANLLSEMGLSTLKFDRYMFHEEGYLTEDELGGGYSLVINTAVFEHVRERAVLDEIAGLVADNGVLALHVLVCESIPKDPNWFYLLPVHCTMFTNRSMQILFEQWNFAASLYHVPSRMWFWFRENVDAVEQFMEEQGGNEFDYKKAFMDYWK